MKPVVLGLTVGVVGWLITACGESDGPPTSAQGDAVGSGGAPAGHAASGATTVSAGGNAVAGTGAVATGATGGESPGGSGGQGAASSGGVRSEGNRLVSGCGGHGEESTAWQAAPIAWYGAFNAGYSRLTGLA